jgi:hypothetical protein
MSRAELAARQAELVAALVAGAPIPAGFDYERVRVATDALLRKRAGEAAAHWPALRAELGPQWISEFGAFVRGRPPQGGLRDGWDLARSRAQAPSAPGPSGQGPGGLGPGAAAELAEREARLFYDGVNPPRPRARLTAALRRRLTALG